MDVGNFCSDLLSRTQIFFVVLDLEIEENLLINLCSYKFIHRSVLSTNWKCLLLVNKNNRSDKSNSI